MHEVSFLLETITPLFMGGADGKSVELRPSAFKGMMRFWWRAIRSDSDIERLWKDEARIFGAADEKIGKSRVKVVTSWDKASFKEHLKPDSKGWLRVLEYKGVKYLLYSAGLNERKFLSPPFEFEVGFISPDEQALKNVIASFWCLIFLGGIGTRARRGGGNLSVKEIKGSKEVLNKVEFRVTGEIGAWIKKNLKQVKETVGSHGVKTDYTSLSNIEILIFEPLNSWERALNKIGEHFRHFRSRKEPDYSSIKEYLISSKKPDFIEKAEFGLPLSYRYSSLNKKSAIVEGAGEKRQRSASPLIFKVLKGKDGFYPLIIKLDKAYLLPNGDKIKIRDISKGNKKPPQNVSYKKTEIIDTFLSSLKGCRRISL